MVVEGIVNLFLNMISNIIGTVEIINLPIQWMNVLTDILAYGIWICGVDVMAIFVATVVFWWVFHMSIGLIVWVWEKLPLT